MTKMMGLDANMPHPSFTVNAKITKKTIYKIPVDETTVAIMVLLSHSLSLPRLHFIRLSLVSCMHLMFFFYLILFLFIYFVNGVLWWPAETIGAALCKARRIAD